MKIFASLTLVSATLIAPLGAATVVVDDDFEGGGFSGDWASTANATIATTGAGSGAAGTDNYAAIASGGGNPSLGGSFAGAADFYVDFFVNVQSTTNRQLNFQLSSTSATPNTNQATLNLRYEDGGWDAFSGGWVDIAGLTPLTAGQWHRVRVTGNDWGSAAANYDIQVSAAGGTTFNSSSLGLTTFQNGDPTTQDAESFNFNARFGTNPGFSIDQVTAEVIPEPSSAILTLFGGLALLRRRR